MGVSLSGCYRITFESSMRAFSQAQENCGTVNMQNFIDMTVPSDLIFFSCPYSEIRSYGEKNLCCDWAVNQSVILNEKVLVGSHVAGESQRHQCIAFILLKTLCWMLESVSIITVVISFTSRSFRKKQKQPFLYPLPPPNSFRRSTFVNTAVVVSNRLTTLNEPAAPSDENTS